MYDMTCIKVNKYIWSHELVMQWLVYVISLNRIQRKKAYKICLKNILKLNPDLTISNNEHVTTMITN